MSNVQERLRVLFCDHLAIARGKYVTLHSGQGGGAQRAGDTAAKCGPQMRERNHVDVALEHGLPGKLSGIALPGKSADEPAKRGETCPPFRVIPQHIVERFVR